MDIDTLKCWWPKLRSWRRIRPALATHPAPVTCICPPPRCESRQHTLAPAMMAAADSSSRNSGECLEGEVDVLPVSPLDSWSSAASSNARPAGLAAVAASRRRRTWVRVWVEKGRW
uniref:Uncharacterized protein n=1 Tax=Setaria italica TaxID=4555 RepID=K3ZY73_SETIT